eukprot:CAMPEP_0201518838 /NCGR_PEP_ID=MMETSP0161_2-20130828/9567_1 /ASSEMBLY_ACC=CAM_ASM_000251 /TAXON_ID=180227 /ORGANISM="Neoparamoeba aestuarina, Strain SoJaBio B1-5/56/2" /LENGTH=599 /DNA_ID=CAMNT_0047916721 /DNA_START=36 /DNA_END=1832 /DNA_ORIENTATION=+
MDPSQEIEGRENALVENCRNFINTALAKLEKPEFCVVEVVGDEKGKVERQKELEMEREEWEKLKVETSDANADLIRQISTADNEALWIWLMAVSQCTSLLSGRHHRVVEALLQRFDWTKEPRWIKMYISILTNLLSAHGNHGERVVSYLIPKLRPILTKAWKKTPGSFRGELEEVEELDEEITHTISNNVHLAFRALINVVPSLPSLIITKTSQHYPHKTHSTPNHTVYLQNLLKMTEYCAVLLLRILHVIVENVIQIDVEIPLDEVIEDDEEMEKNEEADELQFEMQMEPAGGDKPKESQEKIRDMADKLDQIMGILFDFTNHFVKKREDRLFLLFDYFLYIFDQVVIKTHKSKYTQFLLYYLLSLCPESKSEEFLGYLFNKFLDKSQHESVRLCALQYVASFVARAPFVPPSLVRKSVFVLLQEAHQYVDHFGSSPPDSEKHILFYLVVQAVFYVFCFRNHDILDTVIEENEGEAVSGKEFFDQLNFPRLIECHLNPYKICQESVVREFARMTTKRGLLNSTIIIKRNRRENTGHSGPNAVETFFPFDPYLLQHSSKFIIDRYCEWKGSGSDDTSDSDFYTSFSSDEEEEEEEEEEE